MLEVLVMIALGSYWAIRDSRREPYAYVLNPDGTLTPLEKSDIDPTTIRAE